MPSSKFLVEFSGPSCLGTLPTTQNSNLLNNGLKVGDPANPLAAGCSETSKLHIFFLLSKNAKKIFVCVLRVAEKDPFRVKNERKITTDFPTCGKAKNSREKWGGWLRQAQNNFKGGKILKLGFFFDFLSRVTHASSASTKQGRLTSYYERFIFVSSFLNILHDF